MSDSHQDKARCTTSPEQCFVIEDLLGPVLGKAGSRTEMRNYVEENAPREHWQRCVGAVQGKAI